jgi:hypothetical protein
VDYDIKKDQVRIEGTDDIDGELSTSEADFDFRPSCQRCDSEEISGADFAGA